MKVHFESTQNHSRKSVLQSLQQGKQCQKQNIPETVKIYQKKFSTSVKTMELISVIKIIFVFFSH